MKSERRSFPHSTSAFQRGLAEDGDRTTVESKCLACGQIVGVLSDKSLQLDEAADVLRDPVARMDGKVVHKPPSNPIDLETLLHLAQQLYAHALTLQELVWSRGEVAYEAVRPKYDRQAAQQFETFIAQRPPGSRKRGARLCGQAYREFRFKSR